jgi:hypothetical protein
MVIAMGLMVFQETYVHISEHRNVNMPGKRISAL